MDKDTEKNVVLSVENITKIYKNHPDIIDRFVSIFTKKSKYYELSAVSDLSFKIYEGETLGIVGESGCGKSTIGRILAGVIEQSSGDYNFRGQDSATIKKDGATSLRIQMIMQDPASAMNPRKKVLDIIGEAPLYHKLVTKEDYRNYVNSYLEKTGLKGDMIDRYPHMFSGGQKQRINIARALALQPEFLICDESVAALDVSIQAQIINLLQDLKDRLNLTMVFISHDLSVVKYICNRTLIMYLGKAVEVGDTEEIFNDPYHPYTQILLETAPKIHDYNVEFKQIVGEIPSPINPPSGCHFHPRCPHAMQCCKEQAPPMLETNGRKVACFYVNKP